MNLTFSEKLKNFPSVYYPSLYESVDRRKYMQSQFDYYGIKNTSVFLTDRFDLIKDNYHFEYHLPIETATLGPIASFMHLIKTWYYHSPCEEYAIFCDDDTSFESINYWSFTWNEFVENLPKDWECIQLIRSNTWEDNYYKWGKQEIPSLRIRIRDGNDWGTFFLLKRSFAKKILDRHDLGERSIALDIVNPFGDPVFALVENVLFAEYLSDEDRASAVAGGPFSNSTNVYSFPLLLENCYELSISAVSQTTHDLSHFLSHDYYLKEWQEKGRTTSITELMSIKT